MKTLFISPHESSFVKADQNILRQFMHLKTVCLWQSKGKWIYLRSMIAVFFRILFSPKVSLCCTWFADYHALPIVMAARLTRKKSVIFIAGFDGVHYPEFSYGVFHKPLRRFCAVYAMKHCDLIVANHAALLSSDNRYYNPKGHPEGIFRLIPGLKTKAVAVENCITTQAPTQVPLIRKRQILCVGTTPRLHDFYNKGYDFLLEAVKKYPDWRFVFVGINADWLPFLEEKHGMSRFANLTLHASLPHAEVLQLMSETDIYVQASVSEGMPFALMEAMLYGCKPIGSNVAGIPTIIDNWGEIIIERSPEALLKALDKTMNSEADRSAISQSIATRFSVEHRKQELQEVLGAIV